MNTEEIFVKVFSDPRTYQSCPDHETAFNNVLERAKNMDKKENVKLIKVTEITPEYIAAGAAAAIAGAVFGIGWLSEHGGLKEGGVAAGSSAGYYYPEFRADAVDSAETVDIREIEDIMDEAASVRYAADESVTDLTGAPSQIDPLYFEETDITFDLGDITAHISGYSSDGLVLKIKYELTFKDGIPEHGLYPIFRSRRELNYDFRENEGTGLGTRTVSRNGNVLELECVLMDPETQDTFETALVDLQKLTEENDGFRIMCDFSSISGQYSYDFTAHRTVPDIPVIVRELSEEMPVYSDPDGIVSFPEKMYLSAYGVFIDFSYIDLSSWEKICPSMEPSGITLTMSDGSEITITSENKHGQQVGSDVTGRNYVGGLFEQPIDTRDVVSVNILGKPFVTFAETGDGSDVIPEEEPDEKFGKLTMYADLLRKRCSVLYAEEEKLMGEYVESVTNILLHEERIKQAEQSGDSEELEKWTNSKSLLELEKKFFEHRTECCRELIGDCEMRLGQIEEEIMRLENSKVSAE